MIIYFGVGMVNVVKRENSVEVSYDYKNPVTDTDWYNVSTSDLEISFRLSYFNETNNPHLIDKEYRFYNLNFYRVS
jgi:hypothetical protein